MATIVNFPPSCQAIECTYPLRKFDKGQVYFIRHHPSEKLHAFHKKCFLMDLSRCEGFLRTGVLTVCPYCGEGMAEKSPVYLDPMNVARVGFLYHLQQKNYEAVRMLLSTGLISSDLKSQAAANPEFAKIMDESTTDETADSTALFPEPVKIDDKLPVFAQAACDSKSYQPVVSKTQGIVNQYMEEHPLATLPELQLHIAKVAGIDLSLSSIAVMRRKK